MEEKTKCPCEADLYNNCFVEKTEIEGEPFESYMCFLSNTIFDLCCNQR